MEITQRDFTKLLSWLVIPFILSLSISCSSKPEDAIVGKWSMINSTEKMELFKDGTIMFADKDKNAAGNYKFVEKDRIKVELGGLYGMFVATVSISGDELTWTIPDGRVFKFRRAK